MYWIKFAFPSKPALKIKDGDAPIALANLCCSVDKNRIKFEFLPYIPERTPIEYRGMLKKCNQTTPAYFSDK